jgi:hypothetical protein
VSGLVQKAKTGEILAWPYVRQTLSTSPQNTYSVLRPLKATLDDYIADGLLPGVAFWADVDGAMRSLGGSLRDPSLQRAIDGAKAGRVYSSRNYEDLSAALDALDSALARLRDAISRQTPDKQENESE